MFRLVRCDSPVEKPYPVRRALRVHPLRIYLVFQALTAVVALAYAGVLSVDGIGWANWLAFWAALATVGPVRTQLAWGPCWGAGADCGLFTGVRVVLMGESVVHATAAAGIPPPGWRSSIRAA